jgi:sugar phosphate isomerase/epimerase
VFLLKIGVFTILFNDLSLDDTLDYVSGLGAEAVEIGAGGYSKSNHLDPEELLGSSIKVEQFKEKLKKRDMFLSALSALGNPVHPDRSIAEAHDIEFEMTVEVWKNMMSALATVGYDYVLSIEHEDCLMTREEGFSKAVSFLKEVLIKEKVGKMWWETRIEG